MAVKTMQRGHPPIFTAWAADSTLKRLRDFHLPLFLEMSVEPSSTHGNTLRGRAPASAYLAHVRGLRAQAKLDLSHLQPLSTFDFILEDEEKTEVQELLRELWQSAGLAGATAMATKRGAGLAGATAVAPNKKQKSQPHAEAADVQSVADLFA